MKLASLAGAGAAAVFAAAGLATPAAAADLRSMKDGYVAPMPHVHTGSAGPCYFRADVGYSVYQNPEIKWPTSTTVFTGDANGNGLVDADELATTETDKVRNTKSEDSWFGEGGLGCSFGGSRGVRFEAMLGYRGNRKIDGEPGFFEPGPAVGSPVGPNGPLIDPLHTELTTYTLMLNAYKDFGNFGGFIPYVGAGIGAAYHQMDDVYFTGNPNLINRIKGDNDLSFAWSLMAGVGYQISDKAILDVGYRYIDLGKISSQRSDSAGFINPAVKIDDITAHEVKVGLRYHFGGGAIHQPMK